MTPDASFPPADDALANLGKGHSVAPKVLEFMADVQRPTPPLMDEELAEMAERLEGDEDVERLVAEVERLRGQLDVARSDAREDYARAEEAEAEVVKLRAEIARLKADNGAPNDPLRGP